MIDSNMIDSISRNSIDKNKIVSVVEEVVREVLGDASVCKNPQKLCLQSAKEILMKIEKRAEEIALPVVIAIANEWGSIIALHSMDNSLPGSVDIAFNKAYTSAVLRCDTQELKVNVVENKSLYGIQHTNGGRIVVFGGGVTLKQGGRIIGSIGVSGGSEEQDIYLAEYGRTVYEEVF